MIVKTNCKYYLAYKPCKFHKEDFRMCENCYDFEQIGTRILIVKLDALGDVLRTTSILPVLKKKFPVSEITWITKKNAFPLLEGNSFINRKFAIESNFVQYLLTETFDIGICLDADPQSASILTLANAKTKYGFVCNQDGKVIPANPAANDWWYMGINDILKKENRLTYQDHIYKICELDGKTEKPQLAIDEITLKFAEAFSKLNELSRFKKVIGINTGGGTRWQYKKWIFENYIELIKIIKSKHPDFGILLFGGPEEKEMNKEIAIRCSDLLIDAGCDNSIKEFAGLVNLCNVHFTSDSLGMHLSIALNIPTVVIVGPTSPWELDVFGNGEIIYNKELTCISCYKATCDFTKNCMNTLSPDFVYNRMSLLF